MNQEKRICQNCKSEFVIEPQDLEFYERIQVPAPTFCPLARLRPYRLYDRKCAKCGAEVKTSFSPEDPSVVYCEKCYSAEVV